ncbi:MAG TPA: DegT/DnrJ/EryC1/StrS family aminotransferase [Candidatus Kapabacteria bacterium]|nr:DegT/DnrJ/EryC1/StrS family aminotransferase [Candidatus Kapabacteria bacterium]
MPPTDIIDNGTAVRAGEAPAQPRHVDEVMRGVEQRLSTEFGVRDPLMVRTASEGFLCTLLALGIGPGDEVILPVSICHTMINATLLAGATPVLADCDEQMAVSAEAVRLGITPRTRCIVAHHPFGRAVDLSPLRAVAARSSNPIVLVEDCAQALGAALDAPVGLFGDVALFSFAARKPLAAGTGGMVVVHGRSPHDDSLRARLRHTARIGTPGYPDEELLGWFSSPSPSDAAMLLEHIDRFRGDLRARLDVAAEALAVLASSFRVLSSENLHRWPPRSVFHRIVVDLPTRNLPGRYERIMRRLDVMLSPAARRVVESGIPRAPFETEYLRERYRRAGREDLCDPPGVEFPVWNSYRWRYAYLRTDASVSRSDILAACRALVHAINSSED